MTTSLLPLRTLFLGLAALSAAPLALARDNVYWSIGVSPAPGVFVDASNLPPPVVYAPPRGVYAPPPVVYTPPRMVYASPVYLVQPAPPHWHTPHQGRGYGHGHGLGKGHAKWHGHGD
jgi:hypothetical protein